MSSSLTSHPDVTDYGWTISHCRLIRIKLTWGDTTKHVTLSTAASTSANDSNSGFSVCVYMRALVSSVPFRGLLKWSLTYSHRRAAEKQSMSNTWSYTVEYTCDNECISLTISLCVRFTHDSLRCETSYTGYMGYTGELRYLLKLVRRIYKLRQFWTICSTVCLRHPRYTLKWRKVPCTAIACSREDSQGMMQHFCEYKRRSNVFF